jgi:hypothetical protein
LILESIVGALQGKGISWTSTHLYVVQGLKQIPLLLTSVGKVVV